MTARPVLIVAGTFIVVGLVLWLAWVFDPSSAQEGGAVNGGKEFSYQLPEQETGVPSDVILTCSESVMSEPAKAFASWLKLQGVPLELPGGPMALAHLDDVQMGEHLKPAQRTAVEILKRYSPRRVVLVCHTKCLYYDTFAAWSDQLPKVKERQVQDLRSAAKILREWFPQAQISTYLAEEENSKLFFRPIP